MNWQKFRRQIPNALIFVVLLTITLIWLMPFFSLFATAVKSKKDFYSNLPVFQLPPSLCWDNFSKALTTGNILNYMKNGLIVCCLKVPLGMLLEAMAAFAITRLKVRWPTGLFIFFMIGMMLPMQLALVPLSVVYNKLNLLNTHFGLFYAYVGFGLSFGILVYRGFFLGIPKEMDEAALIDGCGKTRLFFSVILPLAKPASATLVISDFLATWNEFLLANIIINNNTMKTVPAGLKVYVGRYGTDYGGLCAGLLISIIPVLIVYILFQRFFVEGMSGALKQ